MELLKIILDPIKSETSCFLCYKECCDKFLVYEEVNIIEEFNNLKTSVVDIVKYLFPSYEIILQQACDNCFNLLLTVYITLRKNILIKEKLDGILQNLTNQISKQSNKNLNNDKMYLKLLPELGTPEVNNEKFPENHLEIEKDEQFCLKCDMEFDTRASLQKHESLAHNNSNRGVVCEYCGKECKSPQTLKVHLNCHKEKRCPYCSKNLKLHTHFKLHIKNHETPLKKKVKKTHYSCEICNFKSLNKNSLEAHNNKVHLQFRPYICEICKKGFYKKSNLTEHKQTHKDIKDEMCELCGEQFVCKKTLKEHLRLHSGLKPFKCEMCIERFVTSGRRSDHFKRKHMDKTISCFACDKKFSLQKELNRHIRNIHSASNNIVEINTI